MRIFVIADASKRKAKPIGIVVWEAGPSDRRGAFSLEICSRCNQDDLPLSLSFCADREGSTATPEESERWVRSRIVPENRHNITEVLRANGLAGYDEVGLLAASKGRSSDDDFLAYEVQVPADLREGLGPGTDDNAPRGAESRADRIIDAVKRCRIDGECQYAFVALPGQSASGAQGEPGHVGDHAPASAAHRVGAQIRHARRQKGLTQKQLAARAGITQSVLSRIESGKGNPTLSLLEDIATALDARLEIRLGQNDMDAGKPPEGEIAAQAL